MKAVCCLLIFFTCVQGTPVLYAQDDAPVQDSAGPMQDVSAADAVSLAVLDRWMDMQIRLMSTTQATFNGPFIRIYAYSGLVAYVSAFPAFGQDRQDTILLDGLQDFPALPLPEPGRQYYWPASLNAAMAWMNRMMFPMANDENQRAIRVLEDSLSQTFISVAGSRPVQSSAAFGKAIAQAVYRWAEADGYRRGNDPYKPTAASGSWKPTAPSYAQAVSPSWGSLRSMAEGSLVGTEPPPPPAYSEDPQSPFYLMVKEVHDLSLGLTPAQKTIAHYWKDINPGVTATGHWLNILRQVFAREKVSLAKATTVYALSGIALNDAWISSWKTRYTYNVQRPITYIREVMGFANWEPEIPTPPHPEYPGGHAALSASVAEILTLVFGNPYSFTDHTYDYLGMSPRTYPSFRAIAEEAAVSKVYGGIHYRLSVNAGLAQGRKVAQNVWSILMDKRRISL